MGAILIIEELSAGYGEVQILNGISLIADKESVTCILGSNGAGKTTLLKAITGIIPVKKGKVLFRGKEITNNKPYNITREGITMVPEGRKLWNDMTVRENIELGGYLIYKTEKSKENLNYVIEIFPPLRNLLGKRCESLSGGEQQMVAIARALMLDPVLLIMDEPSLGLAPIVVKEVFSAIEKLRKEKKTILLVEQNVRSVIKISDFNYVVENGKVRFSGTSSEIEANDEIRKAYFGI